MGGITALKLEFNRTWSVPRDKVPDDAAIAAVLARPTFNDMMMICWTFGIGRVRAILEEMQQTGDVGRFAAAISGRMITNIEKGFALANRRPAAGDEARETTSNN
ncbi:hypothetical protein GGE65_003354 [Skermanella aerolata]|uniref:Uncharacterized protein n=1 Tax=Skermanella aerolata TaxID=393310 RepID=A0A512DSD1_9PROT|nr:hypothetical protein [Skermanella aerolata]KJB96196.1 hypothetical protein N826_38505 [Skermanella aerolata KACC 11604]GEO39384.1 hypothetical protein SAE02_35320 [Skermanella aerolata]